MMDTYFTLFYEHSLPLLDYDYDDDGYGCVDQAKVLFHSLLYVRHLDKVRLEERRSLVDNLLRVDCITF